MRLYQGGKVGLLAAFGSGAAASAIGFWLVHRDQPHWEWPAIEALGAVAGAIGSFATAAVAVYLAAQARADQRANREESTRRTVAVLATKLRPHVDVWRSEIVRMRNDIAQSLAPENRRISTSVYRNYLFQVPRKVQEFGDQIDQLGEIGRVLLRVQRDGYDTESHIDAMQKAKANDERYEQYLQEQAFGMQEGVEKLRELIMVATNRWLQ